jgi:DNA-binding transcriptional LysR family regulator
MTVAQEKSFTKAANLLNISQPAVSQHISELEKMSGVKLFERLHGEVRLTTQGSVFLEHAARILQAYRSASSLFSPMSEALVRVKASDEVYACLQDAFATFSQMHPEVEFRRSEDTDSELSFVLKPAPKTMGGIYATHNIISTMYLFCKPSEAFAQTELFNRLRGFLSDTIS